jgi:hypothetical protein
MSRRRPIGLLFLVIAAALMSAALAFFALYLFAELLPLLRQDPHKTLYRPVAYVMMSVGCVCLLVLTWIAAVTAVDLWRFRKRGRSLAVTWALICGIFTVLADALSNSDFWIITSIQLLSVSAMIYLYLPNIRARFESSASEQANS